MKSTKTNKGITLIALIITIVVLLILAAVAISSIQENGILGYATNAADAWNKAVSNEAELLNSYLDYLNPCKTNGHSGTWVTKVEADCRTLTNGSRERICSVCGEKEIQIVYYRHDAYLDYECNTCGNGCAHEWDEPQYSPYQSGLHYRSEACLHCDISSSGTEACNYENGKCKYCGQAQ